jgi:hypothetical protein
VQHTCPVVARRLPRCPSSRLQLCGRVPLCTAVQGPAVHCWYLQVTKYAFSGGRQTTQEHREKGADLEVREGEWQRERATVT